MMDGSIEVAAPGTSEDPMIAKKMRCVLVVDDEPDIRETLAEILEHDGYQVDIASGGRDALERIAASDYDAILSDIRMPEMNGMELYRRLQGISPDLAGRFIVVTGDDLSGSVRAFLDATGVPFIEKPFGPADVRRAVAAKLGPA